MSLGKLTPGTGVLPSARQSCTTPLGMDISSAVSWLSGAATRSVRMPRCLPDSSLTFWASVAKMSKSVRVCQGGAIAGVKACTNGCMSVLDRSCFSYQVAAGRTTSANRVVEVIRKSIASSRSSLPSGACSCQVTSRGRSPSGASSARSELSAPSRCRRKYSLPLPEEPSRLARQTVRTRGKFSGASGSSAAKRSRPAASSSVTNVAGVSPDRTIASPRSSGFQLKVG